MNQQELKQHLVDWILEHPEQAKAHADEMRFVLDGEHLQATHGITESAEFYDLPRHDLKESITVEAVNESLARRILNSVERLTFRLKGKMPFRIKLFGDKGGE